MVKPPARAARISRTTAAAVAVLRFAGLEGTVESELRGVREGAGTAADVTGAAVAAGASGFGTTVVGVAGTRALLGVAGVCATAGGAGTVA
jgi:hypothetical protein